jgi:hypothetical protein
MLSALLVSPRFAYAQSTSEYSAWAILDLTAAINSAIEQSTEGVELRQKVVRRFSECSLMYGGLATLASDAEAKKNFVQAQLATMDIEAAIAAPLENEKRLELEQDARYSVAMKLRPLKVKSDKEVMPLFRSCNALNNTKEIKNALQELLAQ